MKSLVSTLFPLAAMLLWVAPLAAKNCPDNQAVEKMKFKLVLKGPTPGEMEFTYRTCEEEPQNDLQPPYTTRYYEGGKDSKYTLIIVTDEGSKESEVMLYEKIKDQPSQFAGKLGTLSNASLVRSEAMKLGEVAIGDYRKKDSQIKGEAILTATAAQ